MSARAAVERLGERLVRGARADDADLRALLGLQSGDGDPELARALLERLAAESTSTLRLAAADAPRIANPRPSSDGTFLARLAPRAGEDRRSVDELTDVATLAAVLRGGSLRQRRAAALRIRGLVQSGEIDGEQLELAEAAIVRSRDPEIAYEVSLARAALPARSAREARAEEEAFREVSMRLSLAVHAFWAGERPADPVTELPAEELALVAVRARDLPDLVIAHMCAVLDAADGSSEPSRRLALLSALAHAGDSRLVPALAPLVASRSTDIVLETARALGRIDDPRAHPVLAAAFERSVVARERAVLAGALGHHDDPRGLAYARSLLGSEETRTLLSALEALQSLATTDDIEALAGLLQHADSQVVSLAIRALGRIGDGRAVAALNSTRRSARSSAIRGEIEDALDAIRAQMELRGEEVPDGASASIATLGSAEMTRRSESGGGRALARLELWVARALLAVRMVSTAIRWLDRAASRAPGWAAPLAEIGLVQAARGDSSSALVAFRRAIEADRGWVERDSRVIRGVARVFLRRAEETERAGRVEIARGLLDEVLGLDLRRAPGALRVEIGRRKRALAPEGT